MKKVSVVDFPEEIMESGVKIYGKTSYDTSMAVLSQYLHNGLFDTEDTKETEDIHNEILLAIRDYFDSIDVEEADKNFYGLTKDQEVGLKYGGILKLMEVKKNEKGEVIELICNYNEENKKVKGRIHWISQKDSTYAELRLYGFLFKSEDPFQGGKGDPMDDVNPKSLVTKLNSLINKEITCNIKPLDHFQFERIGYFVVDYDTNAAKGRYVFNLTTGLGDGKVEKIMETSEN